MGDITTIQISKKTRDKLGTLIKHKGETYDQIIERLIAAYNQHTR